MDVDAEADAVKNGPDDYALRVRDRRDERREREWIRIQRRRLRELCVASN